MYPGNPKNYEFKKTNNPKFENFKHTNTLMGINRVHLYVMGNS